MITRTPFLILKIIKIENYREWAKKKYVETKGTLEKEPFD